MDFTPIQDALDRLQITYRCHVPLKDYTTFRIGGMTPLMIFCEKSAELCDVIALLSSHDIPFLVIGEGANLLVADQGMTCPVIRFFSTTPQLSCIGNQIIACASTRIDDTVLFAADHGLTGMNYASGIPGSIGGAVVGNAGAFGSQIGDVVQQVEVLVPGGGVRMMRQQELRFGYRDSALKYSHNIVLNVYFNLQHGQQKALLDERTDLLLLRKEKHPDYHAMPCAGSFFKNIVHADGTRQAAGWFLDRSGCKGLTYNDAAVFEKHANIIINRGHASADDVYHLSLEMNQRVHDTFGFWLEPEVRMVGSFH